MAAPAIIAAPSLAQAFGYGFEGGSGGYNSATVSGGYVGPGDIATYKVWCGLRAYSAAYAASGGHAIDVVDSSGANPATINVLSNGNLDYVTLATWVALHGTASITKIYDQTGNGFNMTQATVANMPIFVLSPTGISSGRGAMQFTATSVISNGVSLALSQPWSCSTIYKVTSRVNNEPIMGAGGFHGFLTTTSANQVQIDAGTLGAAIVAATDNAFNAAHGMANGASSFVEANGTSGTPGNAGASGITAGINFGTSGLIGNICEGGYLAGDQSSNFAALSSNERTYWGF